MLSNAVDVCASSPSAAKAGRILPEKMIDDADPAAVRKARLSELLLLRSSISDCTLFCAAVASDVFVENRWWGVVNASADDAAAISIRAIARLD